ncbi:unnamed protein product [Blumeria hordei]|uniref:Cytochrome b-c1 complex subunit 6, mitochondrial n=2 Tax=Blumeria hordei TaxID=2867405 RepID=A0A383ULR1_BLUHO|nr:ubiquinol-cytochrome c reductase complex subunit [Blumeria hordei DH14]SZF00746.1 unnamed protein product [Blumeria hordei]
MGIFESLSDLLEAAMPWTEAHAEAPPVEAEEEVDLSETKAAEPQETSEEQEQPEEQSEDAAEVEEEEEEIVDPKEVLEEECKNSPSCSPAKHHFEDCVERVTGAQEGTADEDCVEEFFHLIHCASSCAAPKLWSTLK